MKKAILSPHNIILGLPSSSRDEAIRLVGERLIEEGYVTSEYVDAMFEREEIVSTYIGNGIAIPHGVGKARHQILHSGLVVMQYPEGIEYNGNTAYLVIGIAGKDNDHIKILANIAEAFGDEDDAKKLWHTRDVNLVYKLFTEGSES